MPLRVMPRTHGPGLRIMSSYQGAPMSHDHPSSFPHPTYAQYVLQPQFDDGKRHLFGHMIAANEAHTLMLAETGIISREHASALLNALRQVEGRGGDAFEYAPAVEDLFFAAAGRLVGLAGPAAGGNRRLARSRNDLGAAMDRMRLRERLLAARQQVLD